MTSARKIKSDSVRINRHLTAVAGAMLLWSTSFVATKIAYRSFPPLTLGCCRFILASLILAALAGSRLTGGFVRPDKRDLPVLAGGGILGITLYFAIENIGVGMASTSNAALITASYPAITLLMERLFYGMAICWRKVYGIVMAIVGVTLVAGAGTSGEGSGTEHLIGNILLVAAGVVWALYNFATKRMVNRYPMPTVSLYQTLAGTIAFVPLAFIEMEKWQEPTADAWMALFYLGVLCSVMAFMLYNYGLKKLTAGTAVSLANLVPVFGVTASVLVLGEELLPIQLIGGIVVIIGVFLSVRDGKKQPDSK